MRRWALLPSMALLAAMMLLAGCATGTTQDAGDSNPTSPAAATNTSRAPTTAPESSMPTTPFSPKPTPSTKATTQGEITITGVVEEGVERGCTVLRSGDQLYQLIGSADPRITPGTRLRVRGRPNPNLMTTCQQGTPFQVVDIQPA